MNSFEAWLPETFPGKVMHGMEAAAGVIVIMGLGTCIRL